jgi:hypothetical protein
VNLSNPAPEFGGPMSAARILAFGGILLIVLGLLLGEVFAIFISHVGSASIRRDWLSVVSAVEHRDPATAGAGLTRIAGLLERRGRIVNTHSHIIAFGFLALSLAILQPVIGFSESRKRLLALCLVAGGLMQALFVFVLYYAGRWSAAASDAGGFLVLAGVAGNLAGLLRISPAQDFHRHVLRALQSHSSRILLRAGGLLILAGMVFGFIYAGIFVYIHEPRQMNLLQAALAGASQSRGAEAAQAIVDYRRLQSRMAIVTAAHSHTVEMGIMAILLAFVQNFVFLGERARRRWALLFTAGAFLMPVFILCASFYGLLFAALADISGALTIAALLAMLAGLVRYSGAQEASG